MVEEQLNNTTEITRTGIEERLKPVCSESSPVGSTPTSRTYKNAKDWVCKYCGKVIKSRKFLFAHYKECEEKKKLPHNSKGNVIGYYDRSSVIKKAWEKARIEGRKMSHNQSEETKKKLSEARKRNLENGIGNHWINPSIKRSYAEQYFYNCFENAKVEVENNKWVSHYCLDFLIGNKYFEVDGEQHYTPEGLQKDKRRKEFLEAKGYILVARCRWKNFVKLSKEEKENYVANIIKELTE